MATTKHRITGGQNRGLPLVEPKGLRLRPTSGLVREAIFNIVGARIEGARVLDLYAGTGALGMESLSRGALAAVFVDAEASSCQAILQSVARANYSASATVMRGRLPAVARDLPGQFDIVFLDPPYQSDTGAETLAGVAPLVAPGGLVVYEHGSRYNPAERPPGLVLVERRVYGDSAIALYAREEGE
ncbi:MAG TPA: 16S rRNA (guanine(966)-N(2))-methyltransferase RsmD [Tepidiformaceae bacterium]|jgi:16S rRNA (guanine966-N2)-methyltransferase